LSANRPLAHDGKGRLEAIESGLPGNGIFLAVAGVPIAGVTIVESILSKIFEKAGNSSFVWSDFLFLIVVILMIIGGIALYLYTKRYVALSEEYLNYSYDNFRNATKTNIYSNNESQSGKRKCPFCYEMIEDNATICSYCNRHLTYKKKEEGINIISTSMDWFRKGTELSRMHRYREALDAFDKAINSNPSFSAAYYNRGMILKKIGHENGATRELKKAARLGNEKARQVLKSQGIEW